MRSQADNTREERQIRPPRVYLVHGAGNGNVGDSAQMLSASERLERICSSCQVVVAKMYAHDDGALWSGRESAPSLHIYIRRPLGRVTYLVKQVLERLHARRLASAFTLLVRFARAVKLVVAAWCLRTFGIVPLFNPIARSALRGIWSCDLVYCSGGGNLNDIWFGEELLPRTLTYRVAALLGKPLIVSGQGIGPIDSRLGRYLLRWGARHARIFACRDKHESRDLLLQLGVHEKVARSLGDDATDLRCSDLQQVTDILLKEGVPDDGKSLLAVHVRLHDFERDFRNTAIPLLAELLDRLIENTGYRILFIPISYWQARAFEGDLGDAFEVYARMRRRGDVSFVCRERYSPPDMKGIVTACRMMVAFSYHAWVFAMTSGIPAFGLFSGEYFRAKSKGLFDWYDRPNWVWNIEKLDVSDLLRTIQEVAANYDVHREELLRVTRQLIEQVQIPAQMAKDLLDKR